MFRSARDKHEALSTLLINAHEVQNQTVEGSLFKLANGYTVMVKRPIKVRNVEYDGAGHKLCETESVIMADYEEAIPANVLAQQYWLNNRYKEKWKSKQAEELLGENKDTDAVKNVSDKLSHRCVEGVEEPKPTDGETGGGNV